MLYEIGLCSSFDDILFDRMDSNSCYYLDIRIVANLRSRGDYLVDMVVDTDYMNFKDFVDEIVEKYSPRYHERITVAYYDNASSTYLEVKSDQELLAMFAKHIDTKIVKVFISYNLPNEAPMWPTMPASQSTEPTSSQPTQPTSTQPTHEPTSSQHTTSDPGTPEDDDDKTLPNPEPDNEFVGVDEENLYLCNPRASHKAASESESDSDYEEEDGLVGKDPEPPLFFAYDKDNPPMNVGSTYRNMAEFKLALSYYAIKNEFEYDTEKSDPGRVILHCSRKVQDGCSWRLYAHTMDDGVTVEVNFFHSIMSSLLSYLSTTIVNYHSYFLSGAKESICTFMY